MRRSRMLLLAAALVGLVLVPVASAALGGSDRPFQGTFSGTASWQFPGVSPSDCAVATTFGDGVGQETHLGRMVFSSSHCPAQPDYAMDGRLTMTAANGDELYGEYDYGEDYPLQVTWTGGTGRFADASGVADLAYEAVPQFIPGCTPSDACLDLSVPWPVTWFITGTISY